MADLKDWKIAQDVYHRLNGDELRDLKTSSETEPRDYATQSSLVDDIVLHFFKDPEVLIYPAKSYFVAIIYATLLVRHFDEDFYTVLNDPELLYGNDPHFKPYNESQSIYDAVMNVVGEHSGIDMTLGQCPDVVQYFEEEFMIG